MNNTGKALKSGVWYTIGNFISKGMIFLVSPIFNRLMSASDVGLFSNYSSWISLLTIIFTLELYSSVSVARFDYKEDLDNFVASNLILGSFITTFFFILSILFRRFIKSLLNYTDLEINIAFAYFFAYPALQMYQIRMRIDYKYKASTILTVISAFLSSLIGLLIVFFAGNKLLGRIIGNYVPLIVLYLFVYVYLLTRASKISTKYWKYALIIAIPSAIHLLAGNVLSVSDRIMITNYCGNENTGLYSVAYSCGMIVMILWSSINAAWSPWAYEQMDKCNYRGLKSAQKCITIFWIIIVSSILLFAPEILYIMGGERYMSALYVIPPVMTAYGVQAIYTFYVNIEIYSKKQLYIARNTIVAAIANVILNAIFIPIFGFLAAAFTTLAGYVIMLCLHWLTVKSIKKDHWYDSRFNLIVMMFLLTEMLSMLCIYKYPTIRYILIAFAIISSTAFIIRNKKAIYSALKQKKFDMLLEIALFAKISGRDDETLS